MNEELNKILHQPIRTRIMAHIVSLGSSDYNTIKKKFDLSDGHMTTHMRELLEHNYVTMEKLFVDNKPKTIYHVTQSGREAFAEYIKALRKIIAVE